MKPFFSKLALATMATLAVAAAAMAQNPPKPQVPVKVQVVIARYEGDKKVSSLPYSLSVTANSPNSNGNTSIRMGSQVPVPTLNTNTQPPSTTINYMNVGTSIDCWATSTDDGRYNVSVSIEDSSVMERRSNDVAPTLRNFTTKNTVILRDGQTMQFTAAADKTTGEVVKVDVTLTVEK